MTVRSVPPASEPACGEIEVMRGGISASKGALTQTRYNRTPWLAATVSARPSLYTMVMSAHDDHTCDDISQSHRHPSTYSPGGTSLGTFKPSSIAYLRRRSTQCM